MQVLKLRDKQIMLQKEVIKYIFEDCGGKKQRLEFYFNFNNLTIATILKGPNKRALQNQISNNYLLISL